VAVLFALPAGERVPESSRAFAVEVVGIEKTPDDFLSWLQEEYAAEARGWETDEDLSLLMEQTRRRRRFQGFGGSYASESVESSNESQAEGKESRTQTALNRVSGGAGSKSKKEARLCPRCGGAVKMLDFTIPREEAEMRDGCLQWLGPPGRERVAA
jgi:hypothetical protein